jgi:hypothetical protein
MKPWNLTQSFREVDWVYSNISAKCSPYAVAHPGRKAIEANGTGSHTVVVTKPTPTSETQEAA